MRLIVFGVLAAGLLLLGTGCIFSPDKGDKPSDGGGTPEYDPPTSPLNVLSNLSKAYAARDTVEYKELYDPAYVGSSTDLNDPPGTQVSTFRYADEVAHVAALRRAPSVNSVVFDAGPSTTWNRLSSDDPSHPDYAEIQIGSGNLHIEVNDIELGKTFTVSSTNPITFYFKPTVRAPADTTWKIIRWVEVGQTTPGA